MMSVVFRRGYGSMLVLSLFCGVSVRGETLKKVSFLPHWVPQAQFAGYYVAQEKGFYSEAGLLVEMLCGGPENIPLTELADQTVDVGSTFLTSAIKSRAEGNDIINIAQLVQRSALMLVVRADSGIESPRDLNGRRVMLWSSFDLQPKALFRKFDVHPEIIPQQYGFNLFLRGGAAAASAMWYNEYHRMLNAGYNEDELRVFRYEDYGLNFPEDGLYCRRDFFQADPSRCRAFVQASIRGWLYAFEHMEEALDITMRYIRRANVPTTRVHQRWMLSCMRELMLSEDGSAVGLGQLDEQAYDNVANQLKAAKIIDKITPYQEFYENCID